MKKYFILFYLFISYFTYAQKSDIKTIYHFDIAMEFSRSGELAELSKFKLINTENDDAEVVCGNLDFLNVHDFKRGFVHAFKKNKTNAVEEYIYVGSTKKISTRYKYNVKIKKLSQNKYQLTRFNTETNRSTQILIINIEDFEYNAANSLQIHDVLFLDTNYLKKLRRKEKGRNFIIKSYQTTYDGKKINYSSIVKTEKININLTVPKELKFFPKVKMT